MTKEERLEQLLTQLGYDEYDRCSMFTTEDLMLRFADSESQFVIDRACEWWNKELREVNYGTYEETITAFRKAMKKTE